MSARFAILGLMLLSSPVAHADEAFARESFRRAQEHANAAPPRWAEACPLYEASYRADPQIGVLLYLADCHEKIGRIASAWNEFTEAVDFAHRRQDPRERLAQARATALAPRLPKLQLTAPPALIPGLVVQRDGVDITLLVGSQLAIDPGEHAISATAPGRLPWSQTITVPATPDVIALAIPVLDKAPEVPVLRDGTLAITTAPGAEIWIDGRRAGTGTFRGAVTGGGHAIRVVAPGMRTYQSDVYVAVGGTRELDVPLEREIVALGEPSPQFELGASLAPGIKLRADNPVVLALRAEVALRLGRVNVGAFLEYGRIDTSGACGTDISGPEPATPFDIGPRHQFTRCSYLMPGAQVLVHLLPNNRIDPYLGFLPSFRFGSVAFRTGFAGMEPVDESLRQAAIVGAVRAGVTYHPSRRTRGWTVGGYVEASVTVIGDAEALRDDGAVPSYLTVFAGARSTVTF